MTNGALGRARPALERRRARGRALPAVLHSGRERRLAAPHQSTHISGAGLTAISDTTWPIMIWCRWSNPWCWHEGYAGVLPETDVRFDVIRGACARFSVSCLGTFRQGCARHGELRP